MNRDALRRSLHAGEACRLQVYDDATGRPLRPGDILKGHATIGWGVHLCCGCGITQDEADTLLEHRIDAVVSGLVSALPWVQQLDDVRFNVLAELAYNVGIASLRAFTQMLAAAQAGNFDEAARQMLCSRWAAQVGTRAKRLATRMRTGVE